jgi:hypothetical protein
MDSQTKSSAVADAIAALKGIPTKEALLELLSKKVLEVTFNKLDGDQRVMNCTLLPSFLPEKVKENSLEQTKSKNSEGTNIVVWDVLAKAWRSFRYDRVTKVEIISDDIVIG